MAEAESLDGLILRAERAITAREARLASRASAIGARLRGGLEPRRWVGRAGVGVLAVLAVVWLWRRALPGSKAHRMHAGEGRRGDGGEGDETPWLHWMALVWPFLPAAWRGRMSLGTATAVAAFVVPVARQLFGQRSYAPLPTVAQVDLDRYAGRWFEIARLPNRHEAACAGQPVTEYRRQGDQVELSKRCPSAEGGDGGEHVARGVARVVPGSGGARLRVSFAPPWMRWLPLAWGDYWILELDAGYRWALVGTPDRQQLWVLARTPELAADTLQPLLQRAQALGFAADRVRVRVRVAADR